MPAFAVLHVDAAETVTAPDGSMLNPLLALARGSLSRFRLRAGITSAAVMHRTVEELWYCLGGSGELWCRHDGGETIAKLEAGCSVALPPGSAFQFRATGAADLVIVAVTMPPWPGDDEAVRVSGHWEATVA